MLVVAQISSNLNIYCRQPTLAGVIEVSSSSIVKIGKDGENNGEGGGGGVDINEEENDVGFIQREFVYQLAFFFHSLSGSSSNNSYSGNNALGVAIDPTDFYQYLSTNNSPAAAATTTTINTENVGDAAIVFRSLISMLEHSVQNELQRLCKVVGATEIIQQIEKNEIKHKQLEEVTEGGEVEIIVQLLKQQLKTALDRTQLAMHESWSGHLVSRIVGTLTTTTSSLSTCNNADDVSMAHANTTTTTTTTTTVQQQQQRIKKNGNIQRPLPIPLPLPVKYGGSNYYNNNDMSNYYFPGLVNALHSITIEPNPIRGFDWSGLIERGEVSYAETKTFVTRLNNVDDGHEIISVQEEDEKKMKKNDYDNNTFSLNAVVHNENQEINKICHLPSDCSSETTISSSQSNACPTTDVVCDEQEVVYGNEDELQKNDMTMDDSNSFIITNDEHYVAAVMALKKANQVTFNKIHLGGDKIRHDFLMERHHGRGSRRQLSETEGGRNEIDVLTEVVLTGDDNKFMVHEESIVKIFPSSQGINLSNDTPNVMNSGRLSLPAKCISSSEEDSSVDTHVSNVNTNSSDDTHSSAIETPSDIDNISLGSFTDDSVDSKEAINSDAAVSHNYVVTILCLQDKANVDREKETTPLTTLITESSSSEDDNDDTSFNSNSSDVTSSTETDSSSSSSTGESSSSSSSSYSTSSSSVGNTAGDNIDAGDIIDESIIHNNWITRKETRFCLPLPVSLIFHLKRFDYSTISGQVEKLSGFMDIPAVLDIRTCCSFAATAAATVDLSQREANNYFRYHLSGAIVHVDPIEDDNDQAANFGELVEGHYVTFVRDWNNNYPRWIEIDDEFVCIVDPPNSSNSNSPVPIDISALSTAKEHRYATMVIYTREGAG